MKTLAAHYFLPHESNNFRPKTLHFSALIFYITLFLLLQLSFRVLKLTRPDILGYATDINVEKLLNLTNLRRAEVGLQPVSLNGQLSDAALAKANDMFSKNYWAHNAPDGTTPWVFISQAGYQYLYAGENLARDFNDSESVVSAWMGSPSHKENILKREYQEIGFAVVNNRLGGEETTLVVQMFGARQPKTLAQKPVTISPRAAQTQTPLPTSPSEAVASPGATLEPSPSPTERPVIVTQNLPPMALSALRVAGVSRHPLVNFFATSKNLASLLTGGLLLILASDGILIWRRRIVRISGHNLAHLIFLGALLGVLWVTSQGVII